MDTLLKICSESRNTAIRTVLEWRQNDSKCCCRLDTNYSIIYNWQFDIVMVECGWSLSLSNNSSSPLRPFEIFSAALRNCILPQISYDIRCNHLSFISHMADFIHTHLRSRVNGIFAFCGWQISRETISWRTEDEVHWLRARISERKIAKKVTRFFRPSSSSPSIM